MASPKQYKNVYTILEKVKKGEIQSHYKTDSGLFGKIDFYKKEDLVKPYMHYIDESRLKHIVEAQIYNQNSIMSSYQKFSKSSSFKKLDDDKKPDHDAFHRKFKETYEKIPKHLKNDIFKMYYNKIDKLQFSERTDTNYTKFKFLETANNPVGKIMTESSNLKSSIFARNIIEYFTMQMTMMEYVDADAAQSIMKSLNGASEFDNDDIDNLLSKMLGNKLSKDMLEDSMKKAQDDCKAIDGSMPQDLQDDLFNNAKDRSAGKEITPDHLNYVAENLMRINISLNSFKEKIKKIMDKSKNYFSANKKVISEDIFNTDNIAGIDDYIELHPKLRKIMSENIEIKDTKSVGKVNIYIDVSGSMSDRCAITDSSDYVSKLDFCKSFAVKLEDMKMLNKIYIFNTNVREHKKDLFSLANLGTSGGTSLNAVVEHIRKHADNALVITDAEDRCSIYSEKAYFVGVKGARFNTFNNEVIKQYTDNNQMIVFDGTKIYNVNRQGDIIN